MVIRWDRLLRGVGQLAPPVANPVRTSTAPTMVRQRLTRTSAQATARLARAHPATHRRHRSTRGSCGRLIKTGWIFAGPTIEVGFLVRSPADR